MDWPPWASALANTWFCSAALAWPKSAAEPPYATQVDSASLRDIHDVRSQFWTPGKYPASTLVRVSELIRDGALIEIDADAVIATG